MDTISLTCLIEGEDPLGVIVVKINKNEFIGDLKNTIRAQTFVNVPRSEVIEICAVIKERLEGMSLLPYKKIKEYFSEASEENHLSTIIERPQVIKSTSSLEVNQVFSIKTSYEKYRQSFPWIVDIYRASLIDIKHDILDSLPLPQDTKADNLKLRFSRENDKNSEELEFKNDQKFQGYLKCSFSEWKLGTVCDLFELSSDFQEFSKFDCRIDSLEDPKANGLLKHLYKDLNLRTYGRGPLDFCLYPKGIIVGVVEVKKDDFDQGVAQTAMQLHCSFEKNRKRKRNEMEEIEDLFIDKAYGIITDSYDKPKFSIHSKEGSLIDWSGRLAAMENGVRIILGQIIWLLKEAEKMIESKLSEKRMRTGEIHQEKDE
ncbi:10485_t:CDS:2 [Gigaspora rosea]|nr:10485_t:CDS:2 [Gigaspora rosea]